MAGKFNKNQGLNAATGGLYRGLLQGAALGMQARQLRAQESREQFYRQRALEEAQRIDQQLAIEHEQRTAAQEGMGVLASPVPQAPSMQAPMVLAAHQIRVRDIASRMRPELAARFIEQVKEREKEAVLENGRRSLLQDISRLESEHAFDSSPPDGLQIPEEELAARQETLRSGLDNISKSLAAKGDPVALRSELNKLRGGLVTQEARWATRKRRLDSLESDLAMLDQRQGYGPAGPNEQKQRMMLETLKRTYQRYPEVYFDDPKKAAEFSMMWNDAMNGVVDIGGKKVPIGFEEEYVRSQNENLQLKNALLGLQQETERAKAESANALAEQRRRGPSDLERAQTDAAQALADERRGRGLVPPKNTRSSRSELRKQAIENVRKMQGETDSKAPLDEQAVAAEYRRLKELENGPDSISTAFESAPQSPFPSQASPIQTSPEGMTWDSSVPSGGSQESEVDQIRRLRAQGVIKTKKDLEEWLKSRKP